MRPSAISVFFACVALFGAGCALQSPLVSPQIAEPLGETLEERPITQVGGFGELPKAPSPQLRPGTRGSIRVTAEFPSIPPNVTVLRVTSGRPSDTQIRNITGSLSIPVGVVGSNPEGRELTLEWKDQQGVVWTVRGSERRLDFVDESKPVTALTVSALPEHTTAIDKALAFLQDHGVSTKRYGTAYVEPDWIAWWNAEKTNGRCMNAQTIASIRAISASMSWINTGLPTLPERGTTACVSPEFPSRMVVRLNATQDGQSILNGDGSPTHGATILIDAATGEVASGWFTIPVDPVRSDYPALSLEDVRARMARGGQGGTPNGEVTIDTTTFEWFLTDDGRIPRTDFLYPALVGHGTIRYPNGTTSPYSIVVPLVK